MIGIKMIEKVILLTFQTSEFMNYDFVSKLLLRLDLVNGGHVCFNSFEAVDYTAENRNELLPLLNYKKIFFELTTQNNEIKLMLSNHHVIDFSELKLINILRL